MSHQTHQAPSTDAGDGHRTVVLEVSGVHWASSKNVAEAVLSRRPGVLGVDANPVAQTATVSYDPATTSVAADPMTEPGNAHDAMGHGGHGAMSMADMARDMRNRFLLALILTVPISLYSPMGRDMLGFDTAAPLARGGVHPRHPGDRRPGR